MAWRLLSRRANSQVRRINHRERKEHTKIYERPAVPAFCLRAMQKIPMLKIRRSRSGVLRDVFRPDGRGIFRLTFCWQKKNRGQRPDAAERAADGPKELAPTAVLGDYAAENCVEE